MEAREEGCRAQKATQELAPLVVVAGTGAAGMVEAAEVCVCAKLCTWGCVSVVPVADSGAATGTDVLLLPRAPLLILFFS